MIKVFLVGTLDNCDFLTFLVDCTTWNATIAIWDSLSPNQIGTRIDRFCPEISSKEYVLNTENNKIAIRYWSDCI